MPKTPKINVLTIKLTCHIPVDPGDPLSVAFAASCAKGLREAASKLGETSALDTRLNRVPAPEPTQNAPGPVPEAPESDPPTGSTSRPTWSARESPKQPRSDTMNLDAIRSEDEILRVLRAAQERIRDPKKWISSPRSVTRDGVYLPDGSDPSATRWCALGALDWASGEEVELDSPVSLVLRKAAREMGFGHVAEANWDGHDTCRTMFDRAQELRWADMMEDAYAA